MRKIYSIFTIFYIFLRRQQYYIVYHIFFSVYDLQSTCQKIPNRFTRFTQNFYFWCVFWRLNFIDNEQTLRFTWIFIFKLDFSKSNRGITVTHEAIYTDKYSSSDSHFLTSFYSDMTFNFQMTTRLSNLDEWRETRARMWIITIRLSVFNDYSNHFVTSINTKYWISKAPK